MELADPRQHHLAPAGSALVADDARRSFAKGIRQLVHSGVEQDNTGATIRRKLNMQVGLTVEPIVDAREQLCLRGDGRSGRPPSPFFGGG